MIRATPNAVRFDQVNKVNYRFQALHFQSDVLEALVSNSPPLQRRDRAQSSPSGGRTYKEGRVHSDGSTTKQDVLNSPLITKRRISSADSEAAEGRPKKVGTSPSVRRKSGLTRNFLVSPCPATLSTAPPAISSPEPDSSDSIEERLFQKRPSSCEERVPPSDIVDDVFLLSQDDESLEQKSKEELKIMVLSLQRELVDSKKHELASPKNGIVLPLCATPRATSPLDRYLQSQSISSVTRSLTTHVKELETEVKRAQAVASRFQEELANLKLRLDLVIGHCQNVQKELVVHENKDGSSMARLGISEKQLEDDPSIRKLKEISGI